MIKYKNVTCAAIREIIEFIIFDEIQQAGVLAELNGQKCKFKPITFQLFALYSIEYIGFQFPPCQKNCLNGF